MNFITFPVGATNIFPAANSTAGSQLLTEWNIRSREMVGTPAEITYDVGPTYTHSPDDFDVHFVVDESGIVANPYTLEIGEGRALINGYYVETLAPMTIDLVEANADLQSRALPALSGQLTIGFRIFQATEETIAGSILVENDQDMFLGVQTIILPSDEFITPMDSPTDRNKVTAHMKLATFYYGNGRITNIKNNTDKITYISADRIMNKEALMDSSYIRKTGLNPKKIYAFAGKGTDPSTGLDTWQDVTDSLIVWDANPERTTTKPPYTEAQFTTDPTSVYLCVPHDQVEGMETAEGDPEYYAPRFIQLPTADYGANTPGIVNKEYTKQIKLISNQVEEFRTTLTGKQIMYMNSKIESTELPPINADWSLGDYILVGTDYTADDSSDGVRPPSTMYVILPGIVQTILFSKMVVNSDDIPEDIKGAQLGLLEWYEANRQSPPDIDDPANYPIFFEEGDNIRGTSGVDYFRLKYTHTDNSFENYYFLVDKTGKRDYSDYVMVTGEIPLAQEEVIGGFLNVSTDNTDYGYVYRDEYGRLKLLDYGLLRSGTLAYQLAENLTLPAGVASSETQSYLDEYVNQRIAFPNEKQLQTSTPNCINIYIYLYAEDEETTITISDIDSRFNTSVCLHIMGESNSNTIINILDCQKLKIDNLIEGTPTINVYRTNLFYDPLVFNYIRSCQRTLEDGSTFTGLEDISIWYEMFDETDPNLLIDGMTVSELDAPITPTQVSYWANTGAEVNDNYYLVALNSITFSGNGDIVKCGMLVANQSTDNVTQGDKIVIADFELPQGAGLSYPKACMTKQMKVTGSFVSAYLSDNSWFVTNTLFSALTQEYDQYSSTETTKGNIAFHSTTTIVPSTVSQTSIPVWETDTYHLFYGGILN